MQNQNTTTNNSSLNQQPTQNVESSTQESNRYNYKKFLLLFGAFNVVSSIVFGLVKGICNEIESVPNPPHLQNLTTRNDTLAFEEFFNKKVDKNNNCQIQGAIISLTALTAIGAGFLLLKRSGLSCLSNQTIARNNSNVDADLIIAQGDGERNEGNNIIIAQVFDDRGDEPIASPQSPRRGSSSTNLVIV
jgi:hypothetical protein